MRISTEYKVREMAGEHIIVMPGRYGADMTRVLSLNATSLYLWEALVQETEFSIQEVTRLLITKYAIDAETAARDASAWIEQLQTYGIIKE